MKTRGLWGGEGRAGGVEWGRAEQSGTEQGFVKGLCRYLVGAKCDRTEMREDGRCEGGRKRGALKEKEPVVGGTESRHDARRQCAFCKVGVSRQLVDWGSFRQATGRRRLSSEGRYGVSASLPGPATRFRPNSHRRCRPDPPRPPSPAAVLGRRLMRMHAPRIALKPIQSRVRASGIAPASRAICTYCHALCAPLSPYALE